MPNPKERRTICWTFEQQIKAANAIPGQDVCAAEIRLILNHLNILKHQKGNQSIGQG